VREVILLERVKLTFLTPEDWHQRLKLEAVLRRTTATKIIIDAVDEWLKNHPRDKVDDRHYEGR
jgi:hypothetical protein